MDLVRENQEKKLEMEVVTEPDVTTREESETSTTSYNIDSFPDQESPQININNVIDGSLDNDVPIDLDQLIIDENGYVQTVKRELRVSIDHVTGNTVVSVVEGVNRDVVRHILQDEIFAVERLITAPAGMLFRSHA